VRDVRSVSLAVCLTVIFALCGISSGFAASNNHKAAAASYRSNASAPASRMSETPPNCVRESCGRLWCWHLRESAGKR
jgi:hypothetical protein